MVTETHLSPRERCVAVFGSSEPTDGSPLYGQAREIGRLLAMAGYTVVTGGYGGVMEGASRGAAEAGGDVLGITTRAFATFRSSPNRYLTRHIESEGLFERTRELIERSGGYIILSGKAGTLSELTFLWALQRARLLGNRPIVLMGDVWRRFLESIEGTGLLDPDQLAITFMADSPEEAVEHIRSHMR